LKLLDASIGYELAVHRLATERLVQPDGMLDTYRAALRQHLSQPVTHPLAKNYGTTLPLMLF
jgi:hypothetical protein